MAARRRKAPKRGKAARRRKPTGRKAGRKKANRNAGRKKARRRAARKTTARKAAPKQAKRTTPRKKVSRLPRRKSAARKKPTRKPARRTTSKRTAAKPARKPAVRKQAVPKASASAAERGLVSGAALEVGVVSHYFSRAGAAVVALSRPIHHGDTIHVRGATTDFVQAVDGIALEGAAVREGVPPQSVGLRLEQRARTGDRVYRVSW
jgi:putative protease